MERAEVLLPQDLRVYLLILQDFHSVLRTSFWNASVKALSEYYGVLKLPSIKMPLSWAFSAILSLFCFETLFMMLPPVLNAQAIGCIWCLEIEGHLC